MAVDVTAALTAIEKQLPDLLEASKTLANSAPSTSLSAQSDTTTPWSNRESYVPWAAQRMASEAGEGASFGVSDVKASMRSGTQENAEVSFADKILEDLAQMEGPQALTRALRGSK